MAWALGISGDANVWSWENWLLIEDERGLPPTWYSGTFDEAPNRAKPRDTDVSSNDPRLVCGELGSSNFASEWRNEHNYNGGLIMQDYELRSLAVLSTQDGYINSEEIIENQSTILDEIYTSTGGYYIDPRGVSDELISRGGEFEVPNGLLGEDQIFIFYLDVLGMESFSGQDDMEIVYSLIEGAHNDWKQSGMTVSWKEYLQEIGVEEWRLWRLYSVTWIN